MSLQMGSRHTRGPWNPDDWADDEGWLAQRDEFTRAGHGIRDRRAYASSLYGGNQPSYGGSSRIDDMAYTQWRDEELRRLDEEYEVWRVERYQRFVQEYEAWRRHRRQARSGSGDTEGAAHR